ncbi:MAG: DUF4089 domain-containing protein [Elainellaceae cyanobacterium]
MSENHALSFNAEAYVEQASLAIGLAIAPDHKPGVVENMEALYNVAQLVMAFPLPKTVEAAPVFNPLPPSHDAHS